MIFKSKRSDIKRIAKVFALSLAVIIAVGVIALIILLRLAFAPDIFMKLKIDNHYQVEFFTEYHDDPGIPIRAYIREGKKTHEVSYLENYRSIEDNTYSYRDFSQLGLVTVFNTNKPNRVMVIIDKKNRIHFPLVGVQHENYWNQVKDNIRRLYKEDQNLDFSSCYWNWRDIL